MKKVLIPLTILILALLLYVWLGDKSQPKRSTTDKDTPRPIDKLSTLPISITTHTNDIEDTHPDEREESYPKNNAYAIFEELDIDSVQLDRVPIEGVKPISALRMKQGTIKEIEVSDTILLPNIDGTVYELTITGKDISPRGNVSVDGSFSENGVNYSAILTEGSNAAFISMNTPEGTYEVELLDGIGFVYNSSDIDNTKIDYTKTDEADGQKEVH